MEDLYRVGERVSHDGAAGFSGLPGMPGGPGAPSYEELQALLSGGGDIEQYLQSYEQMLQEGIASPGVGELNKVDAEGGITVRPDPGFVIKTRCMGSGMKIFLNVVSNEHVEAPHMKSLTEMDGEEGCRVPMSIGMPVEDFDKKKEPCVTYDIVCNPKIVEECKEIPAFRDSVVQLCYVAIAQKYSVNLDPKFKLPKMKYKGDVVQLQRLRKKTTSQIQELTGSSAPLPGAVAASRAAAELAALEAEGGPPRPDFCVFYALAASLAEATQPPNGFLLHFAPWPEDPVELEKVDYISGLDLPCYEVVEFQEKLRGTMRNEADRKKKAEETAAEADDKASVRATKAALRGRLCVVQTKLPKLDRTIAALKQVAVEVSDECLRLGFPPPPRCNRSAYAPLTVWWPRHFYSAQAVAEWDSDLDILTVTLPADFPEVANEFDEELLDAVF